ncbi:unnamed protein product [Adineta steineri]|uniref:Uncharacterized protein n=1 Tax=Adineta steineri TaxID=433720 RepID=A0A819PQU8_9BILA|nr:unnamed protein product [Adineta steineri]CAF4017099.1 unnamed protein product [Adineta steineri]
MFILILPHHQIHSQVQLSSLNQPFRHAYSQARNHVLSKTDPLITINDGNVILIHHGKRIAISYRSPVYQDLKAISHIPLTIYLFLFNLESNDYDLSLDQITQLKYYLQDISTIRQSYNFASTSDSIIRTQYNILDQSIVYLRSLLESKRVNQIILKEFCIQTRILFSANVNLAARNQLDVLHSIVYPWYKQLLNETERETVKVLILAPKAARDGTAEKLYFYGLFNEYYEGERIIYAESIFDEEIAINILDSWILDTYAADAFFDDPTQLHRDVMANEAMVYVKKMFKTIKN